MNFMDDESALPQSVNVRNLNHFEGVKISVILHRKSTDVLIGQTDRLLLSAYCPDGARRSCPR